MYGYVGCVQEGISFLVSWSHGVLSMDCFGEMCNFTHFFGPKRRVELSLVVTLSIAMATLMVISRKTNGTHDMLKKKTPFFHGRFIFIHDLSNGRFSIVIRLSVGFFPWDAVIGTEENTSPPAVGYVAIRCHSDQDHVCKEPQVDSGRKMLKRDWEAPFCVFRWWLAPQNLMKHCEIIG